ncbi:Cytochrome bo(3) ubiquinol oxidase subunit 4 [Marinomonas gallaica]|uniref:Cytochrome bo(3) ubiquinol oxidase subunit 4 n=1 Tax=Marinomonas gallaica TaxID=1806667 RepID=A0A1C3JQX6_9GAMM|nr:cytochrome o ubiquinol oxidase subunit IV [Marinomonas gallaica]SBT17628.1 Cytochrome bo(3) ubiquinol oxidase subunit 4 [Marinomonas gallaica]SBT19954.1 Cytochrome bo(3) ubiquinol oxidase subunit 4 [Marinomonas gallaica]
MSQHDHDAHSHGSVSSYVVGFVLSVILTVIPFWAVMTGAFDRATLFAVIVVTAVVQIVVHLKYFLHLNFTKEGKIDTLSFIFTAIVIVMVVALSIWIIYESVLMMMY